jgi:uncharacterized membrane protein YqgA involved in biofilm formation
MIGLGTAINAVAVLVGSLAGLLASRQISQGTQVRIRMLLALFTVLAGFVMIWKGINGSFGQVLKQVVIMMLSLMLGNVVGKLVGIQKFLSRFGEYARQRFASAQDGSANKTSEGFLAATVLFCVGPMSILGAVQDGLTGDIKTLAIKSAMDGLASMVFASTFGWGVLLSIIPLVAYQGTITLSAKLVAPYLTPVMIDSINATGGMIVVCITLVILEVRKVELADYLPSLAIAPLLAWWWL